MVADTISFDPHWYAWVMRNPATPGSFATFMIFVNAIAWLVSRPMMPTLISACTAAAAQHISAQRKHFMQSLLNHIYCNTGIITYKSLSVT